MVKVTYNGSAVNAFTVLYDSNGRLAKAVDGKAGITYLYEYDSLDRLIRAYQKDSSGNTIFAVENSYDSYGRPTGSTIIVGSKTLTYSLTYKTNTNLVSQMSMPSAGAQSVINYTYDSFDRLTVKNISLSSLAELNERYTYYTYIDTYGTVHTTPLVSRVTLENAYGGTTSTEYYDYTYNSLGYITNVKKNGTTIASYGYDALGQLSSETNSATNQIYIYSYDKAGNITKKDIYVGDIGNLTDTINYTYSTSAWGDLLTNYDGNAITYDSMGNPTKWVGIAALTWKGRQLTYLSEDGLDHGVAFTYNADGVRTKKVFYDYDGSVTTHNYVLDGTNIISETVTNEYDNSSYTLYYVYDENGHVTGLHYNNQPYYFQKNMQGDILRILDKTGTAVVEYVYDAWGNILSTTGSMASTLGQYNSFRYRGYYYDSETGFYYLESRYYDPAVGRFINADGIIGANDGVLGYNMFAYCNNNFVMGYDPTGECWRGDGYYIFQFAAKELKAGDMCHACGKIVDNMFLDHPYLWTSIMDANPSLTGQQISDAVYCAVITDEKQQELSTRRPQSTSRVNCFVAGTLVKTKNGDVAIENIEGGDYVWAHNPETEETALKRVVQTFVNETDVLVEVVIGNETIKATPEHPFYVVGCNDIRIDEVGFGIGWVKAEDLRVGDTLCLLSGETVTVESVTITYLDTPVKVYNFEVEDFHTYFVGEDGWLVHNDCRFTAEQDAVIQRAKAAKDSGLQYYDALALWRDAVTAGFHDGPTYHSPRFDSFGGGNSYHLKINGIHIKIY